MTRRAVAAGVPVLSRLWDRVAGSALLFGVALRLESFLERRPVWIDESMLALNILTRDFHQLTEPLDLGQSAPIALLWGVRFSTELFGVSELSLRLVPMLAGVAFPFVTWAAVRRMLGSAAGALAAVLASCSLLLIYYSNETKQYGVDALVTASVLFTGSAVLATPADGRRWVLLGIAGVAGLTVSQPAIFVLVGFGVALLASRSVRGTSYGRARTMALGACWMAAFAGLYFASYQFAAADPSLLRFWEGTFLVPGTPDFPFRLARATDGLLRAFPVAPWDIPPYAVAMAFLLGFWGLWRAGQPSLALMVLTTYGAVFMASAVEIFPIADRLLLFLAPLSFLLVSGWVPLTLSFCRSRTLSAAVHTGVILGPALIAAGPLWHFLRDPRPAWNTRALIQSIPSGEPVYVLGQALTRWAFYTTDWNHPEPARLSRFISLAGPDGIAHPNSSSRNRPVRCEGDSLVMREWGRVELIGIPMGIEFRLPQGHVRPEPDVGWAANEARRMRNLGEPSVWIFASQFLNPWLEDLSKGIRDAGGQIVEVRMQERPLRTSRVGNGLFERSAVFHVVFPAEPLMRSTCEPLGN